MEPKIVCWVCHRSYEEVAKEPFCISEGFPETEKEYLKDTKGQYGEKLDGNQYWICPICDLLLLNSTSLKELIHEVVEDILRNADFSISIEKL